MIVTGASSGIGRALAERAARHGYDVLAIGRRVDRLADLERRAVGCPGRISTLAIDLRSPNAARIIVSAAQERFGGIDVLVNNAGGVAVGAITDQTDDQLHEQFETHVYAPLALTREALPLLRASHGHVFFLGSGVARVPVAGLGAYPPAKAAVRSMTRIVRAELRADGIAVTYVDPGAVDTEFMTRAGFDGPPKEVAASPDTVARRIMDAVYTRKSVVNAVPWQTAIVALAELFPALTDAVLARAPRLVGTATPPKIADAKPPALPPLPPLPNSRRSSARSSR
jgi:short-subunit dehydrogenase